VLAHLWSCGEVWGGCIRRVLAEDVPTIRAVNPRTWLAATEHRERGFAGHLAAFTQDRPSCWTCCAGSRRRTGRAAPSSRAGRPLERTVLSYSLWLASHERRTCGRWSGQPVVVREPG
jgi:hypothetical protein